MSSVRGRRRNATPPVDRVHRGIVFVAVILVMVGALLSASTLSSAPASAASVEASARETSAGEAPAGKATTPREVSGDASDEGSEEAAQEAADEAAGEGAAEAEAEEEVAAAAVVAPRAALGLGLYVRIPGVPFVGAALYSDDIAFSVEGIEAQHSLFDFDARTRVIVTTARYRVPLAWHDWRPFADVGLVSVQSRASGVDIGAQGFAVGAGVERPLGTGHAWHLRGEARYVRLLDEPHWLFGIGLEWRLPLPDVAAGSGRSHGPGGAGGRAEGMAGATAVSASGRITGVSLPMSASGTWEFSADLVRGTASVFLDGRVDGESGSHGFGNATRVSFDGSSLSATFEERDTHEGKPVRATVSVSASPSGFSLSISARRSDGLSASAGISGRTTQFEVVPLVTDDESPSDEVAE